MHCVFQYIFIYQSFNIAVSKTVTYEQPLNEKTRIFLRLEFLFLQVQHTLMGKSPWDTRSTIISLHDILNILSRNDIKSEVIKELERQINNLNKLQNFRDVDQNRLEELLSHLTGLIQKIHSAGGQPGNLLRDNEFLSTIKQRLAIPGGTCNFDLPAYHYWLQRPAEQRIEEIQSWMSDLFPIEQAIQTILDLIRTSAPATHEIAEKGFYQKSLANTATSCQMVRVTVSNKLHFYPEVSGNKLRFNIRFLEPTGIEGRANQTDEDVGFKLICCLL